MRIRYSMIGLALTAAFILSGCTGNSTPTANNAPVQTNAGNSAANGSANAGGLETTRKAPEATTNNAPTLAPVFKAYCDAMTRKDEAALRKLYSQASLKALEEDMKAENQKSLVGFLEVEQISNKLCDVRNEKIDGDVGVAEVTTEGMPNGARIKFVKENGEWKITNESPDVQAVKQSATNTNASR